MKKGEKGRDENNFCGLTLKIEATDSCALIYQDLCIRTCRQAPGIAVLLVYYALNLTDAAVQSNISKDSIRCFLINMSFVFCPSHIKFWVKLHFRSQYFLSLSFPGLIFYLLCYFHATFSTLYRNISNINFRT